MQKGMLYLNTCVFVANNKYAHIISPLWPKPKLARIDAKTRPTNGSARNFRNPDEKMLI